LVVTFTNNAASQMKDKIRDMLYKSTAKDEQFIYEQINALENCNISTLHSFCIETIRKYYHITASGKLYKDNALEEWKKFSKEVNKFLERGSKK